MRPGLIAWCVIGAGLIGLKAYLDLSTLKHGDIAVRAGDVVYRVPRSLVTNAEGWRADVSRLSGCWDVREAGLGDWFGDPQGCAGANALHLDLARMSGDEHSLLKRYATSTVFWRAYSPPVEHVDDIESVWNGRDIRLREDWRLYRYEAAGSPWVYLFTAIPQSMRDVPLTYAGRCYRSDFGSDIGMSCILVFRLEGGAGLEYSIGPDGVPELAMLQREARNLVAGWK